MEPPLPRRKKCPELAYKTHEFITAADGGGIDAVDSNVVADKVRVRASTNSNCCFFYLFLFYCISIMGTIIDNKRYRWKSRSGNIFTINPLHSRTFSLGRTNNSRSVNFSANLKFHTQINVIKTFKYSNISCIFVNLLNIKVYIILPDILIITKCTLDLSNIAIIDVFQLSYFVKSKLYNPNNVLSHSLYIILVFHLFYILLIIISLFSFSLSSIS